MALTKPGGTFYGLRLQESNTHPVFLPRQATKTSVIRSFKRLLMSNNSLLMKYHLRKRKVTVQAIVTYFDYTVSIW
jgi:hypothetical protein